MKRINLMPLIYFHYFAILILILLSIFYLPLIVGIGLALAVAFFGALITNKAVSKHIINNNPFLAVQDTDQSLVFAFVPPNRILMFNAKKDLSRNKIRIRILKDGRYEIIDHFLTPNQEFLFEPNVEIKEKYTIYELLQNPFVAWELDEPIKKVFKVEPFGVDAVVLVYPNEIITQEQLKLWNLKKIGEEQKEVIDYDPQTNEPIKKIITIPLYSPQPYAISSDNLKQLSAHHRFSQISTILEQTRDILRSAEGIASAGLRKMSAGLGSIFDVFKNNPMLLVLIALLIGAVFFMIMMGKFTSMFNTHTQNAITDIFKNATRFPKP